jgi:hypothetical protein
MSPTTKLLLAANALCLMLFLGLAFLLPLHGQSQAQQRFTQLDKVKLTRTGPANQAGPWIAAPAITATRSTANIGIGLTLLNVSLFTAAAMPKKKKS